MCAGVGLGRDWPPWSSCSLACIRSPTTSSSTPRSSVQRRWSSSASPWHSPARRNPRYFGRSRPARAQPGQFGWFGPLSSSTTNEACLSGVDGSSAPSGRLVHAWPSSAGGCSAKCRRSAQRGRSDSEGEVRPSSANVLTTERTPLRVVRGARPACLAHPDGAGAVPTRSRLRSYHDERSREVRI